MKKRSKLSKILNNLVPFFVVFAVLIIFNYSSDISKKSDLAPKSVMAAEADNMSGYAWSDNIGWISFNCTNTGSCATSNYGVGIGGDKELSGYAWSDNIGWISFNRSDLSGCPKSACKARLEGYEIVGWARALSGMDDPDDGWDGWISLGTQPSGTVDYGVELNASTFEFDGYAWGGEVVGWIDFSPSYGGITFTGTIPVIKEGTFQVENTVTGEKPYVDWQTEDVVRCDLTSPAFSAVNACTGSGCATVNNFLFNQTVEEETTYTLTCFSDIGLVVSETNRPTRYFDLSATPTEVTIDFVGSSATTTPTNIGVIPYNGFKDPVSFSANVSSLPTPPSGPETSSASFSRVTLPYAEYSAGVKSILEIFAAYRFIGEETVRVYGNNPAEFITITIDAGNIEPIYEEI